MDFDDSLPRTPEFELLYARFVGAVCRGRRAAALRPGRRRPAHRALLRGWSANQRRLTSRLGDVLDLVREASFWARPARPRARGGRRRGARDRPEDVSREPPRGADAPDHRRGHHPHRHRRAAVGQVNGLAVLPLGDYAFGRPARITARTFAGRAAAWSTSSARPSWAGPSTTRAC